MSCTYTKISLTRKETSFFFFFFPFCAYCKYDWRVDWCLRMHWLFSKMIEVLQLHWRNEMDNLIFTAEILNYCPENGRSGLLMYINENVFNSGVLIPIYDWTRKPFTPQSVFFFFFFSFLFLSFAFEAEIQVGVAHWSVCRGEPAKPGPKFFMFCFFLFIRTIFGSIHCNEFRTSSSLIISQVLCLHVCFFFWVAGGWVRFPERNLYVNGKSWLF